MKLFLKLNSLIEVRLVQEDHTCNVPMKYGGEEYDILDRKLQVFYDCCSKIGLPEAQYHYAYSAMLKGRVSFFYYDKIIGRMYDFQAMVAITKAHFETEENR